MPPLFLLVVVYCLSTFHSASSNIQCFSCHTADSPAECLSSYRPCQTGEVCATDVILNEHGERKWNLHCKKEHECPGSKAPGLLGRKRMIGGSKRTLHPNFTCQQCCTESYCNLNLCRSELTTATTTTTTTTTPVTTATSTLPTTTQTQWPCIDLEARAGQCAQLKAGGHCLPVEGINYETAKLRCRHTCRFC